LGRQVTQGQVIYLALEDKRSELKRHFTEMGGTEDDPIRFLVGRAPEEVNRGRYRETRAYRRRYACPLRPNP